MANTLRLNNRQAAEYHKVIHKYGKRIEKEARRDYRYWDKSAARIYDLRIDRDQKVRRILTPSQFNAYINFTRERPQRIHDYRGWYENPRYAGRYHSPDWRRYEDRYWSYHWNAPAPSRKPHYDNRPPHRDRPNSSRNGRR